MSPELKNACLPAHAHRYSVRTELTHLRETWPRAHLSDEAHSPPEIKVTDGFTVSSAPNALVQIKCEICQTIVRGAQR